MKLQEEGETKGKGGERGEEERDKRGINKEAKGVEYGTYEEEAKKEGVE